MIALVALAACSPSTRLAGRCPTLAPLVADFAAGGVALSVGVDAFNDRRATAAGISVVAAMAIWVAAGLAECER